MQYRMQQARLQGKSFRIRYQWVALNRIPRLLQRAVILSEDAAFWVHRGFDWHELKAAFQKNWQSGKVVRGGSTITQQLAKNLFLSPERSIYRKLKEMGITYQLERHLSKKRILELYLNLIELGPGVFGVQAAAKYYFGVSVANLTPVQILLLAASIPSPLKHNPKRPTRRLFWRANIILNRMKIYDDIPEITYAQLQADLKAYFGRQ